MTSNKKQKTKKTKKEIIYRTKKQRQDEVKTIISQLNEFNLNIKYEPVHKLYVKFKTYIATGRAHANQYTLPRN